MRISAVIACYNHGHLLMQRLHGLVDQVDEIIIVDDCSTDDTPMYIQSMVNLWPMLIRASKTPENLGASGAYQFGLTQVTSEYVGFFACDDKLYSESIADLREIMDIFPGLPVYTGKCEFRCADTGLSWVQGSRMGERAAWVSPNTLARYGELGRLEIPTPPALYRTRDLVELGGINKDLAWLSDWYYTHMLAFRDGMGWKPKVLAAFIVSRDAHFHKAKGIDERITPHLCLVEILYENRKHAAMPYLIRSGAMGGLGPLFLIAMLLSPIRLGWINWAYIKNLARRTCEIVARKSFPKALNQWLLKRYYR